LDVDDSVLLAKNRKTMQDAHLKNV